MFALNNISHSYNNKVVLSMPQWEAQQGESWLMLGPSGSGKTTLLHILAGLLKPTSGTVTIHNKDFYQMSLSEMDTFRGQNIGIVFQRLHLLSTLSVKENLRIAQFMAGLPQDEKRVENVLDSLDMLSKKEAYPNELSHGQAQRISIARAVINKPKLILADEPTSALDDNNASKVLSLLQEQAKICNATLIITTHDQRIKHEIAHQLELGGGIA